MTTLLCIIALTLLALAAFFIVSRRRWQSSLPMALNTETYNPAYKRWINGKKTLTADADFTNKRFYLVKVGTDQAHMALVAATSDKPLGINLDEPLSGNEGTVAIPGPDHSTRPVVASGTIHMYDDLYSDGTGKVMNATALNTLATAGVYWKVGKALAPATASGQVIEASVHSPICVAVLAALTSTQNSTTNGSDAGTTQTLANALKVSYNALQLDVSTLATAVSTNTNKTGTGAEIFYLH
jgi:hypothetical protein